MIDKIYAGLATVSRTGNDLLMEVADEMKVLCDTWGQRQGFGAVAEAAFEDCKSSVSNLSAASITVTDIETSDGLHEEATAENIAAFVSALGGYIQVKDAFIYGYKSVYDESATPDTENIFATIGSGIEKFTNSIVDVLEANKDEVAKFGIALDDAITSANKTASRIKEAGQAKASKAVAGEVL